MPSKDILSIILFISVISFQFIQAAEVVCDGHELSADKDEELENLTEKKCTVVKGNIILRNLKKPVKSTCFLTVRQLEGSLIIENTENLHNWVNLQNLAIINSGNEPALIIKNNINLNLGIGAKLRSVESQNKYTYIILNNQNAPIDINTYNILHYATTTRAAFLIDSFIQVEQCRKELFKWVSIVLAGVVAFVSGGLIIIACYGREVPQKL
ncbi:unnamed protein product [Caenorhabditis angaria]|uniref:Receptor L-domain domain-containing protein n=1 Tax=Caenorhabditis angaria TaxID=860376 RepID=A0A9P1INX9_9PELO|nr:unnamed protein product [Caenorhabditis angaria]